MFMSSTGTAQEIIKASEVTPAYLKILCATSNIEVLEIKDIGIGV